MNQNQPDRFYEVVGRNIKKFRMDAGLNQTTLAAFLRLSRTSIVNIEQGRQHPSLYQLWQIAWRLNTTVVHLLPTNEDLSVSTKPELPQVPNAVKSSEFNNALTQFMQDLNNSHEPQTAETD